ncbi:MAG: Mu-like prophage major head subunit gpT family protein [Arsenophonus sp. NEOnobi-MAG3]
MNNKNYKGTIAIIRDDFKDENLGAYKLTVSRNRSQWCDASCTNHDELVFRALCNGNKIDCYDGKHF